MMIHAVSGATLGEIDRMPFAAGLHWCALWWQAENARRQLAAFSKVPEIRLLRRGASAELRARVV